MPAFGSDQPIAIQRSAGDWPASNQADRVAPLATSQSRTVAFTARVARDGVVVVYRDGTRCRRRNF